MSAIVADASVMPVLAQMPASRRQMIRPAKVGAKPAAILKSINSGIVIVYIG